jgi:2-succinyl-6-hydroxy-2,4-cyclohexadiene-1-carboxylate synthase
VLISGTAGIEDVDERRLRRESDRNLADELDPHDGRRPMPVATFLRRWLDKPMFADISPAATAFEERLRNTGPGLASSLRLAGTGSQQPLWPTLAELAVPVLIISGALDQKFTALGHRLTESIGANATHVVVAGAGHAPHLQQPATVAALVRSHLGGSPRP